MIASRTFEESGLSVFPLYDEKLFAALPADHSLAKSRSVSPRELSTQSLLLLEDGHCLRDETVDLCRLKPQEGGEAHAASLETLRHLVASGAGVAVLPGLAVEGVAGSRSGLKTLIEYRAIDGKSAHREIALYARSSDPHLANARALARVIRGSLRMDSVRVIDKKRVIS
jgi:LysR family hydrogen peroxide-inducible transcriptional activator